MDQEYEQIGRRARQEYFERWPENGVRPRNTSRRRFAGSVAENVVEVLVAYRYRVIVVPGVGFAIASLEFQSERTRQPERAQEFLEFFQDLPLLHEPKYRFMIRILGWNVFNLNPIRSQLEFLRVGGFQM